ncbi:MAG TPA: TetR/AcrR family transcriptional regulator [Blastocatellia bacterium]|nr:TetR/AcrR family transcriptional regulator [Blastocatellia bacterium]
MPKGQKTRARIIAEAASLFNQRGFEGGSLSELMEATGLEKGGIYRHFSSKEELAGEAFDYAWKVVLDTRMHDLNRTPNSVDKLQQFIANFINRRPSVPGGCPLLNTAIDADDGNLVLRERARKGLQEWRDRLSSIVASGIKRGEIRRGVDAKEVSTLIISSLEGALVIGRLERNREALVAAQSHLERYLETEVRLNRP